MARCRESFSSLVFSQTLLSQTQPWGNATDTQFFKVSHFYSLFSKLFFNNYNIQTIAIRFAMVRKITFMTKISNGLLDQVTHGNRIDLSLYLETKWPKADDIFKICLFKGGPSPRIEDLICWACRPRRLHEIYPRILFIDSNLDKIKTIWILKKQCLWQGWISNGSFLDLR